jgi:hypothetical protein
MIEIIWLLLSILVFGIDIFYLLFKRNVIMSSNKLNIFVFSLSLVVAISSIIAFILSNIN